MAEPSHRRYTGKPRPVPPPAFDLMVVTRPLTVELFPKQLGAKLMSVENGPRSLMKTLKWPSSHTSVVATVKGTRAAERVTVATWNVADPVYSVLV